MEFVKKTVYIILAVVILGFCLPVLWPLLQDAADAIAALSGGAETDILQAIFPVALVILAIGIAAGLIFWGLKQFGVVGSGGPKRNGGKR